MKRAFTLILAIITFIADLEARITLPSIFSDNMVLQQRAKVRVWGWADPDEKFEITTTWSKKSFTVVADEEGVWSVYLETPGCRINQQMKFRSINGDDSKTISNILIGEVWLASGQSNMEFWLAPKSGSSWMTGANNWEKELDDADYPYLHLFKVDEKWDYNKPQKNCSGKWVVCSRESAEKYSAIAFLFGRELHKRLDRPVGIILSAFGGTHAESWTRAEVMQNDPIYERVYKNYSPEKCEPKNYQHKVPSAIWNAMVNPIAGYTIKGNIWYQAESNAWRAEDYAPIFFNMANDWRNIWQQKRLPFYIMQVAPFATMPGEIRDEQVKVWKRAGRISDKKLHLKDVEFATAIDVGDSLNIHPEEKLIPAQRFLKLVLANEYGIKDACYGPIFKDARIVGDAVMVTFKYSKGLTIIRNENENGNGTESENGNEKLQNSIDGVKHNIGAMADYLYIAGSDGIFHPACSKVVKGKLRVWSPAVKEPVYIKYCSDDYCKGTIYNSAGLPAFPFKIEIKD